MSNFTAAKKRITNNDEISKKSLMKKFIKKKYDKHEPWFKWLTRELNSYEAFQDFDAGKNPENVAEDFISKNEIAISEVFEDFDKEDKDTLDQFRKLTECELHVFKLLEKHLALRSKVIFVDFKKK